MVVNYLYTILVLFLPPDRTDKSEQPVKPLCEHSNSYSTTPPPSSHFFPLCHSHTPSLQVNFHDMLKEREFDEWPHASLMN